MIPPGIWVAGLLLASGGEPLNCEDAPSVRRGGVQQVLQGNIVGAVSDLERSGTARCLSIRPYAAQLYAMAGDWGRARDLGADPRYDAPLDTQNVCQPENFSPWRAAALDRARRSRLVVLNEYHHDPAHRAFASLLAEALYEEGFRYLAVEDLTPLAPEIERRGWVRYGDSWDSSEPQFAHFIEHAIELGYTLVNYEWMTNQRPGTGNETNDRERIQAENILARTLEQDPAARVLVYAGRGHAREDRASHPYPDRFMAGWLGTLSGLDPFTISQTSCDAAPAGLRETSAFLGYDIDSPEEVAAYDAVVRRSPAETGQAETWPRLLGHRSHNISTELLSIQDALSHDRLYAVEARLAGLPDTAVPDDRVLVRDGKAIRDLWLGPGRYSLTLRTSENETIALGEIDLNDDAPSQE